MYAKLYNSFLMRALRSLPRRLSTVSDKAEYGNVILKKIAAIDVSIFPMFGTLLSITRDKKFLYADDFDFGTFDAIDFRMISKFESHGFELCGASIVGDEKEIIELSFKIKINDEYIKVDVFNLCRVDDKIRHKCPNFRREKEYVTFENKVKVSHFKSYFYIDYPEFNLVHNSVADINCPSNPEEIFTRHYGKDWQTPKKKNFIDYEFYNFISQVSVTITGESDYIKTYLANLSNGIS